MGILNVTPDSFSDGGNNLSFDDAISHCDKMISDGADIIDIGGESTRPGASEVSKELEIKRVIPIIKHISQKHPDIDISIDTSKYEVAKQAVTAGANIINDVTGLANDPEIAELAAENDTALVIMHMQGTPRNMQKNPTYNNVVDDIFNFLKKQIEFAKNIGVRNIYADFGIGFGKTLEHNIELLRNINKFKELDASLLLGISRKSFIGMLTDIEIPAQRDISTALIHAILLNDGIDVIRVHNVELHGLLRRLFNSLKKY